MIKALYLWILSPIWEVRIVSSTTGKDIPGRCVYKGGYWGARKQFRRAKAKTTDIVRLQAVIRADWRQGHVQAEVPRETSGSTPDMTVVEESGTVSEDLYAADAPQTGHECNEHGPLDYDSQSQLYLPTCSVCGKFQFRH